MIGPRAMVVDDIVTGEDARVLEFIQRKLGAGIVEVPAYAIGVLSGASIVGGAYFYSYRKGEANDIYTAVALEEGTSLTRGVIRKLLAFPFGQCDLPRVSADIDESNTHALAQAKAIGFEVEGVKRGAGKGGGNIVMLGLLRSECAIWNAPEEMK